MPGNSRPEALDPVNVSILAALAGNPRIGMSTLARQVGMSAPAVTERAARLEESGVIRGFRLRIDPAALGRPVAAWVRVRPGPGQLVKVAELAASIPEIVQCDRITGEDCFLFKVYVPTVTDLETVLDRFLLFGQTTTSIVQSSPVPQRPLPLPEGIASDTHSRHADRAR